MQLQRRLWLRLFKPQSQTFVCASAFSGRRGKVIVEKSADMRYNKIPFLRAQRDGVTTRYYVRCFLMNDNNKNNKNNGLSGLPIGMCIGIAIGTAIGAATRNMGLWMPIGLSVGMCLGLVLGRNNNEDNKNDKQ